MDDEELADEELDYELPITFSKKHKKEILKNLRNLDDDSLWEVAKIFDFCGDCWHWEPEKCELRPIRKKLGLGECEVYRMRQNIEIMRKKRLEKSAKTPAKKSE